MFACAERSEEHTSELQSRLHLVCRLLLEKKKLSIVGHLADPEDETDEILPVVQQVSKRGDFFQQLLLGSFELAQYLDHVLVVVFGVLSLVFSNTVSHQCKFTRNLDDVSRLFPANVENPASNASLCLYWKGHC